ncbi:SDR family oxidoreductase [Desulfatibacillum aliphaticivorans]|uniref:SDR family oxidoreductase n=1 Tax=Desulfatibacillum aliphaticivorans TaxID=218208 RepID=UPI00040915C7|nr:SDR family oxidoreductase [Desulfatibacillum aliphaticivorans]
MELSPVRTNTVSPGFVRPQPKQTKELAKRFPVNSLGRPEDIAMAYIYLMTHPYTTGHILVADGGALLARQALYSINMLIY